MNSFATTKASPIQNSLFAAVRASARRLPNGIKNGELSADHTIVEKANTQERLSIYQTGHAAVYVSLIGAH